MEAACQAWCNFSKQLALVKSITARNSIKTLVIGFGVKTIWKKILNHPIAGMVTLARPQNHPPVHLSWKHLVIVPVILSLNSSRKTKLSEEIDSKVISLFALGMNYRNIQKHIADMYALDISEGAITNITDKLKWRWMS